jgi:hypothetical protein
MTKVSPQNGQVSLALVRNNTLLRQKMIKRFKPKKGAEDAS